MPPHAVILERSEESRGAAPLEDDTAGELDLMALFFQGAFLLLEKMYIKIINYYKDCYVNKYDSIRKTYDYMGSKNITGVPIVDNERKFIGLLTSKMIGSELINGNFTKLNTSYNNILDVLKGEEILRFDEEISGNILAASFRSTTILNTVEFRKEVVMNKEKVSK